MLDTKTIILINKEEEEMDRQGAYKETPSHELNRLKKEWEEGLKSPFNLAVDDLVF